MKENCKYCGKVMTPGKYYWGDYCPTGYCFNSEMERHSTGPRNLRRKEEDSK